MVTITSPPRVAVAIVTYNQRQATLRLLDALRPLGFPVYVTENAGQDGSADAIRHAHPWVSLLESPANLGGCGGFNLAVLAALSSGSDYVLLIDDDALPVGDCITALADFLDSHPDYVFAAPAIYITPEPVTLQETGGGVDFSKPAPIEAWNRFAVYPELPPVLDVDYASACFLMVRAEAITRLGVMDWNFFIFSDDVDWSLRLRETFGKKGACVTTAKALHDFPWAKPFSPMRLYFFHRNGLYLIARHARRPEEQTALPAALYQLYRRWIYSWLVGDREIATTLARVFRDSWRRRYGAWADPIVFGTERAEFTPDWFSKRRIRRVLIDITIEDNIPGCIDALCAAAGSALAIDLLCDAHRVKVHRERAGLNAVRGRIPGRLGQLKTFPHVLRRFYDLVVTDAFMEPRRPTSMAGRHAGFFHNGRLFRANNRPLRALVGFVGAAAVAKLLVRVTQHRLRTPPELGKPPPEAAPVLRRIGIDPAVGQPWARDWPLPFLPRSGSRMMRSVEPAAAAGDVAAAKVERSGGYDRWRTARDRAATDWEAREADGASPIFSVLVPVCDPKPEWLQACIDSVLAQRYSRWELILSDDASELSSVRELVAAAPALDPRIRTRHAERRGGVSAATNAAAAEAKGDLLLFLDHDDCLDPLALAALVQALQQHPAPERVDVLYADEDRFGPPNSSFHPGFKPEYSPELLLRTNYIHHPVAIRRRLFETLGGLRSQYDGSQDHDLLLRAVEHGGEILRVPDILYHMRVHSRSLASGPQAKPDAHVRDRLAIADALDRRGLKAEVIALEGMPGFNRIRYQMSACPSVSVLQFPEHGIPAGRGVWAPHEVITIAAGELATAAALSEAVSRASGDVVIIASAAVHPQPGWEDWLLPPLLRDDVGIVGGRLEYADGTLYASGLVLGMAGVAGRWHHGCSAEIPGYGGWVGLDHEVSALPRQLLALRRERLLGAGGFDIGYRAAGYELDLALRLTQENGLRHWVINAARFALAENYPRHAVEPWEEADFARLWTHWGEVLRRGDPYVNPNISLLTEGVRFLSPEEHELRLRGCFMAYDRPSARRLGERLGQIAAPDAD